MLTPPTLYSVTEDAAPKAVQSLPATFDAKDMTVEKRFATSKDGTKIPYFLVRKTGAIGPVPALIHAYGGFRSEEHTSELQSLMRSSYAVFCLKKKIQTIGYTQHNHTQLNT